MGEGAGDWLVFACATTYTAEVAEIIWRRGEAIRTLVDNLPGGPATSDLAPVIAAEDLDESLLGLPTVVPPTTPGHRREAERLARACGLHLFPRLVDPTSIVGRTADIDEGTTVNARVVVGARTRVGRFVCVNRSASLGHDGHIDDYATLGPGCVLGGHVTIGRGAFLGVGAICAPEVTVGANATVGAGAVVIRDLPAHSVAVGNPARVIREGEIGYGGVGVPS